MKAKTLIELLTLSTNIYMITKDERFMNNLSEMTQKGKEKVNEWAEELSDMGEEQLMEKLIRKASEAKIELEQKIEETARKVYEKAHIAHTDKVNELEEQIKKLKEELAGVKAATK